MFWRLVVFFLVNVFPYAVKDGHVAAVAICQLVVTKIMTKQEIHARKAI